MHQVLEGIVSSGRVASAYLFVGPPDSAKAEAAEAFAGRLGVKTVDRLLIQPSGAMIKIEQVREAQRLIRFGPSASGHFVVIIEAADEMNDAAAGALLKTLEETPPKVVFILLAARVERLPATIISRCQKIIFGEAGRSWEAKPELNELYAGLGVLPHNDPLELLALAARLDKEKDNIETVLYDLAFYAWHRLSNVKMTRILLDTVKDLKRKANRRLALDVACLKMGEACQLT